MDGQFRLFGLQNIVTFIYDFHLYGVLLNFVFSFFPKVQLSLFLGVSL